MNPIPFSRRNLMKLGAGALLVRGLWPGALAAQDAQSTDFTFIEVNDLHYIDENCRPFFTDAVANIKAAAPMAKLALIVGDTCENGTAEQLDGMREILKTLGMEVRVVPGNHDWTTDAGRAAYDRAWPDSLNYAFDHGGWQFVGLDTTDGTKYEKTSVQKPTLDWLDRNLPRLDPKRPTILFTHFPLGQGVRYRPANADELLARFKSHNLRGVFNGHYHAITEKTIGSDVLVTTGRCCSFRRDNHDKSPGKGFFRCTVADGHLTREFVEVSKLQAPK